MTTAYGDISPRTAAHVAARLLTRAMPAMCLGRFGQQQPIPKNKTNAVKWRRYNSFAPSLVPLVEGVTPAPDLLTYTDYTATLKQYGRRLQTSDVVLDTHEDPILNEMADILGEVAGQTQETVIYNAIKGGTNVLYAAQNGGTGRAYIHQGMSDGTNGTAVLDKAIRQLMRQNTKMVSRALTASDKVGTSPIRPAFIAVCHPDLQKDLEAMTGWKNPVEYGSGGPMLPNEGGAYKNIRFLYSTLFTPWLNAATNLSSSSYIVGGSAGPTGNPDVYPIIIFGMDAFATVTLAGENAVTPIVVNPKPSDSDPLAQRGHVGFKTYLEAKILNDAWMVRVETLAKV